MNPIAVSIVVFFLSFQAIYLYVFTQNIANVSLLTVMLISAVFAVVAGYTELEWYVRQKKS